MFAAATREVVFSNRSVVEKVKANFVLVALKAAIVANPPAGPEGDLYRMIKRTRPAPQGMCVLNSSGAVLTWALSFRDERVIPVFFDHAKVRYEAAPTGRIYAERFRTFPHQKMPDVPPGELAALPDRPADGEECAGTPSVPQGGLVGTIVGRRLSPDGMKPVSNTRRQENYMEARVELPAAFERGLLKAAADAGDAEFTLPDELCRVLLSPAYLGQLDVNPLGVRPGKKENRKRDWKLVCQRAASDKGLRLIVAGSSHLAGGFEEQPNGPTWDHVVKLQWQGYFQFQDDSINQVCLLATGSERLKWGNQNLLRTKEPEPEHLMAGHPIDFDSQVVYGLLMER